MMKFVASELHHYCSFVGIICLSSIPFMLGI